MTVSNTKFNDPAVLVTSPVNAGICAAAIVPDNWDADRIKADKDVKVAFVVAVILLAVPVVFWFRVGKFDGIAETMVVPLPYKIPVTVVLNVNAGVAPPEEAPAKPFALATETAVTAVVPLEAEVTKPLPLTVKVAFI